MSNKFGLKDLSFYRRIKSEPEIRRRYLVSSAIFLITIVLTLGVAIPLAGHYYNSQIKVIYSLDKKQNSREVARVIDEADKYVYFAIYFFTKDDIAQALIRAKKRGLVVWGIMDREASGDSNKNILTKLEEAGIKVESQKHPEGIMHIKALVTDKAYLSGSYNWTASATNVNDEVLEIGRNESVRKQYLDIIQKLLLTNGNKSASVASQSAIEISSRKNVKDSDAEIAEYSFEEAVNHIGEEAVISGKVVKVFTSKSNTTFLDFCSDFKKCSFSAVIFASDKEKFGNLKDLEGDIRIHGLIKSYQGKAEIILEDPEQVID